MPDQGPGRRIRPFAKGDASVLEMFGTMASALVDVQDVLDQGSVAESRREAMDIIAALLDVPRFWPAANLDARVDRATRAAALVAADKRARGAPFAYAVGRASFRHLTLDVDERVLIPRQETEQLVEIVLGLSLEGATAVDVGTGSGAIAFALATEGQFSRIVATDISLDALDVARRNADLLAGALRAPVELRHGADLAPLSGLRASLIVSNPPYISYAEAADLPPSVRDWEPALGLFGGADGMTATRAIIRQAADHLEPAGYLALEVDARRASLVAECCAADGRYRDIHVRLDLTGRERFVLARRQEK